MYVYVDVYEAFLKALLKSNDENAGSAVQFTDSGARVSGERESAREGTERSTLP